MNWQVQEAKQRFSEVLRAVEKDGPQIITKHGEEVAVVINIDEYRRLAARPPRDFIDHLMGPPYFSDEMVAIMEEIESERKKDFGREIDFGVDT